MRVSKKLNLYAENILCNHTYYFTYPKCNEEKSEILLKKFKRHILALA